MEAGQRPVFYYDLASPYSYLAAFRLKRVLPVPAVWEPVWIAGIFAAAGRDWRRPAAEVRERQAAIERRAAGYGMPPWRWPPSSLAAREAGLDDDLRPTNTLVVMRVAALAHRRGVGETFALRAFHLTFGEGHELAEADERVIEIAVEAGLAADEARAAPADPEIKLALRTATEAASARGVTGLPTIAVGDRLFWGDDRLEEAASALAASV